LIVVKQHKETTTRPLVLYPQLAEANGALTKQHKETTTLIVVFPSWGWGWVSPKQHKETTTLIHWILWMHRTGFCSCVGNNIKKLQQ
jgi:hypothetical protein